MREKEAIRIATKAVNSASVGVRFTVAPAWNSDLIKHEDGTYTVISGYGIHCKTADKAIKQIVDNILLR